MSWELSDNMRPVQTVGLGNCSACCLRNVDKDKFCKKMCCYDEFSGGVIYWTMLSPGQHRACLIGVLSDGMADWFNARSCDDVKAVATMCIKRVHENEIQK